MTNHRDPCRAVNTTAVPRPEHPRPDFSRDPWLNLNGWWAFAFDPDDRGEEEGWPRRDPEDYPDRIQVPFPWESLLAWGEEVRASDREYYSRNVYRTPAAVRHVDAIVFRSDAGEADYRTAPRHTIGWYCRGLEIPAGWHRRRIFLCIGAADFHTKAWVNGQPVGEHIGGYTPFDFEVTSALHAGARNTVVIRVFDAQAHEQQPGGKQHHWYQRTSGIWQTVYLEARGAAFVRRVHVTPDVAGRQAHFKVSLADAGRIPGARVRLTVTSPDHEVFPAVVPVGGEVVTASVALGAPDLWDVDHPALYVVTVDLVDRTGRSEDRVSSYFGMRSIGTDFLPGTPHRYVFVNGRPAYLRGVLDQGFHPAGVYSYPSDATIREDIRTAKQSGFNMIRIHIKLQDPRYLYWADREGMLLLADIPNFGYDGYTAQARGWWEQTLREAVARDFNHPAIFGWCLFNEGWGVGGERYAELPDRQAWVGEMYRLAKRLDPTRLVEDMSANHYDHVDTDLNSWHFYIKEYEEAKAHISRVVTETHPGSPFNYVPGARQRGAPLMNSEYGGISAHDGDKDTSWHLRMLTNELRLHEQICGYVYTELTDLEWEHNGVVRYDRTRKEFGYPLPELHAADVVAIDAPPLLRRAAGSDLTVPVRLSLFSGKGSRDLTLRWRLDAIDTTGRRHAEAASGGRSVWALRYRVQDPGPVQVALPPFPHLGTLHIWLEDHAGEIAARSFMYVDASGAAPAVPPAAAVLPGSSRWQPPVRTLRLLADVGMPVTATWGRWERLAGGAAVAGLGEGSFGYALGLESSRPGHAAPVVPSGGPLSAELVCEAAAGLLAPPQTDVFPTPTVVQIRVGQDPVGAYTLPDAPADVRGCLSWAAGLQGQYGYLIRTPLLGNLAAHIAARVERSEPVRVTFTVDSQGGGLALFGARTGRYPVPLCILVHY